jgi:thiol-disulfide isomerase/thioredoxin
MRFSVRTRALALTATLFAGISGIRAGALLEPIEAPQWKVSEWINGNPGRLADLRGKVVLINFFQMWCPGSNEFSLPLFEEWARQYGDRDDVVVVSIHTVFEEHDRQTPEQLRRFVREMGITHPVGIDAYDPADPVVPITMKRYQTGGTPHVAIVDKEGMLRFSHFGRFERAPVEHFIDRLLEEEKQLNIKSTPREKPKPKRGSRRRSEQRQTPPPRPERIDDQEPEAAVDEAEGEQEPPDEPDTELTGSYKLRFEQLSKTCGSPLRPIEVITQVTVLEDQISANFSRPFLGIRRISAEFDGGSGHFEANLEQQAKEKGDVDVDLTLHLSGRFVSMAEPPEIEFDYYLDERSADGTLDCTIEGRGGGPRFRSR